RHVARKERAARSEQRVHVAVEDARSVNNRRIACDIGPDGIGAHTRLIEHADTATHRCLAIALDVPRKPKARLYLHRLLFLESTRIAFVSAQDHAVVRIARAWYERADQDCREQLPIDWIERAPIGRRASPARWHCDGATRLIVFWRFGAVITIQRKGRRISGV